MQQMVCSWRLFYCYWVLNRPLHGGIYYQEKEFLKIPHNYHQSSPSKICMNITCELRSKAPELYASPSRTDKQYSHINAPQLVSMSAISNAPA